MSKAEHGCRHNSGVADPAAHRSLGSRYPSRGGSISLGRPQLNDLSRLCEFIASPVTRQVNTVGPQPSLIALIRFLIAKATSNIA